MFYVKILCISWIGNFFMGDFRVIENFYIKVLIFFKI